MNSLVGEEYLLEEYIALIVVAFSTADHALDQWPYLLRLLGSRCDALMRHQVSCQVPKHGLAVLGSTVELTYLTLVPHFLILVELLLKIIKREESNVRLIIIIYIYIKINIMIMSSIQALSSGSPAAFLLKGTRRML